MLASLACPVEVPLAAPLDDRFIALQEALLGRYSLERELGRGGMGTVYLARDVRLDRPVAIKSLHPELASQPEARRRFLTEARTAAALAHPHIVSIFAVEERESLVCIVMALVDGETLGERIRRRGPLAPDDTERMLRETAWALGYAHAHGVVHRDLTLANILLERGTGRALVADFGLAGATDAVESTPLFGTPGFLAPEVIRGEPATPRSDLYALGVVGYTALAGRPPFEAESSPQLLAKHLVQPAPPLGPLAKGASRRLVDAIECCLAKAPEARPADPPDFLARLERAPEPVAIAPALRNWFTRWTRIKAIYALATPILAMQTWLMIYGYFQSGLTDLLTAALVTTILTLTAIPILGHLLFEAAELRSLRRVGYGVDDLRAAFPHWREEQIRNRRREGLAPLGGRVIFDLTVLGAVAILIVLGLIFPNLELMGLPTTDAWWTRLVMIDWLSYVYLGTLTGIGIGFLIPGHRPAADGRLARLIERFWKSRLAGFVVRLSAVGQRGALTASSTLHRNTEMVLGLAVDDLWKSIPDATRDELGDVPLLAHTLQGSATQLREMIDRLRESEREVADEEALGAQLAATRESLEARHKETVTSLERIRLQLLRLLATRERTVELTQQIENAKSLEHALLHDVAGYAEVRQLIRRAKTVRTPGELTPTPSPA